MSGRQRCGVGILVAALLLLAPARARACISGGELVVLGLGLLIVPSETGTLVTNEGPRYVLGWSWQVPVHGDQHRLVGGVSWIADAPHAVEGRLGYRYAVGRLFGGLGVSVDGQGSAWSPELGINLLPRHGDDGSLKVHLLVRGQIAPELNQFRGVSLLVGWTAF